MHITHTDTLIIGGGTAGCLLANRLSARRDHEVLLLEAGKRDDYHWIHIPAGYLYCIGNPRSDWLFHTTAQSGLGGRSLRYPRGKVLGGSSSINGMIYMRGHSQDYDDWAAMLGDDTWNWHHCLAAFRQHEDHHQGSSAVHGAGGEWRVERMRVQWNILQAVAQAAQQAGIPRSADFNGGNNEGVGYFEVNQKKGLRWSSARAFLRPTCYGRSNFGMWTGAHVTRLLFAPNAPAPAASAQQPPTAAPRRLRCIGAEVCTGSELVQVHVRYGVVLCAGSIGSVQILERSGIGQAAHLHRLGIAVQHDLPGVGANLQDHLQLRSVYRVEGAKTLNTLLQHWWSKGQIALQYALKRSGPLSMAPSQLGIFTRSQAAIGRPDLQYHVQPLSLDAFGAPLHPFPAITASVCNLRPTSRGSVHITSADVHAAPRIDPNYLATAADQATAIASLRLTRRIMAQPALARYRPQEYAPGPGCASDSALLQAAGAIANTIFHPVGTTAMGPASDPLAVVDARLRVHGVHGLRIADAGVMPRITSGNTNSPVLMIAEKAAAWLRQELDAAL